MAYRLSVNDEFDGDGVSVEFVYRHNPHKWHPCDFSCNGDAPINKAAQMTNFVLDRKTWRPS